ncbi:MAG: hypothetical protein ACLS3M_00010 [Collinsella sp.]
MRSGAVYLKFRTPALCFSATVRQKLLDRYDLQGVGVTIVSSVHCLVHDANIHLLTIQFGRLIIGVVMLGNDKVYRQLKAFIASAAYDLQLRDDIVKGLVSR